MFWVLFLRCAKDTVRGVVTSGLGDRFVVRDVCIKMDGCLGLLFEWPLVRALFFLSSLHFPSLPPSLLANGTHAHIFRTCPSRCITHSLHTDTTVHASRSACRYMTHAVIVHDGSFVQGKCARGETVTCETFFF